MAETFDNTYSFVRSLDISPGYVFGFYDHFQVVAAPFGDSAVAQVRVGFDPDPLGQFGIPRQFVYESIIPGGGNAQSVTLAEGNKPRLANMDEIFKLTSIFSSLENSFINEIFLLTDK